MRRGGALGMVVAAGLLPLVTAACNKAADLGDLIGSASSAAKVKADFQPAPVPPGVTDHFIALQKSFASKEQITLDVVVTDVSEDVSGIAIKLSYDTSVGTFVGCSDGALFQPGNCHYSEQPPGSGVVFIGRSITAPEPAVPVAGSRTIVTLAFRLTHTGDGPIVFEAKNLGGGDATALLDANGDPILVTWVEGSLVGD